MMISFLVMVYSSTAIHFRRFKNPRSAFYTIITESAYILNNQMYSIPIIQKASVNSDRFIQYGRHPSSKLVPVRRTEP